MFLVLILLGVDVGLASVFEGTISSQEGYAFLGKFCFDDTDKGIGVGSMTLTYSSPNEYTDLTFLLYDDEDNSWPSIFSDGKYSSMSCNEKREASKNYHNGALIDERFHLEHTRGGPYVKDHIEITEHSRPRFWFVAVANCEGFEDLTYNLHMVNFEGGFPLGWTQEFGFNEAGLNTFYLLFFLIYTMYLSLHAFGVWTLHNHHQYVHPLIRLFCSVLVLQYFSILFHCIHYAVYSENGYGITSLSHFAEVLSVVSQLAFLLLLMLLAKGWTILNDKLEPKQILSLVAAFTVLRFALLFWKWAEENPANTSPSTFVEFLMWCETAVWVVFAVWFLTAVTESHKNSDDENQKFLFKVLMVVYGLWIAAPATLSLWVIFLDPWIQFKTTAMLHLTYTCASHFFLTYLLWPSRVDTFFQIKVPDVFNTKNDYSDL